MHVFLFHSPADIVHVADHSVQFIQTSLLSEDHGALSPDIGEPRIQNAVGRLVVTTLGMEIITPFIIRS